MTERTITGKTLELHFPVQMPHAHLTLCGRYAQAGDRCNSKTQIMIRAVSSEGGCTTASKDWCDVTSDPLWRTLNLSRGLIVAYIQKEISRVCSRRRRCLA